MITQIDITCNIAFLDICDDATQFYLLCCSGQQYPEYPCFGNPETGFAQHSSICRAALASGVKCGQQFFAFYVGENCRFTPFSNKEMMTYAYEEWSKTFKIKQVKNLFSEHKKLFLAVEETKKKAVSQLEKINELQFEVERLKREKDLMDGKFEKLAADRSGLTKLNKALKAKLSEAKKFPFEEYERLQAERKLLIRKVNSAEQSKTQLQSCLNQAKTKLDHFESELEKNKECLHKKRKVIAMEKELTAKSASEELRSLAKKVEEAISTLSEKGASEKEEHSNAVQDMKQIFEMLSVLKTRLPSEDDKDLSDAAKKRNGEVGFMEMKRLMAQDKGGNAEDKSLFAEIAIKLETLQSTEKSLQRNSALSDLRQSVRTLLENAILTPIKTLCQSPADIVRTKDLPTYDQKKQRCEEILLDIAASKKEKNISQALKSTAELQNLIQKDIVPLNKRIAAALKAKAKTKSEVKEDSWLKPKGEQIDADIDMAKNDLVSLEKMSPVPKEKVAALQKELADLDAALETGKKSLDEQWALISQSILNYIEKLSALKEKQTEFATKENRLEALKFKILRWEEAKNDKRTQLAAFIEAKGGEKAYVRTAREVFGLGRECLRNAEQRRAREIQKRLDLLEKEHCEMTRTLRESLRTDLGNKKRQLQRLKETKKGLEAQLEEAMELMDEETVHSLEEQIERLPSRSKALEEKIGALQNKLAELK